MKIFWDFVLEGILGSIGYGVLGLLLALTILFILRSKGALKRSRAISKFLVITYLLLTPLIFGAAFTVAKAINYAENRLIDLSNVALSEFEEQTYPTFHEYFTENIEEYAGETVLPTNDELVNQITDATGTEPNWITKKALGWFIEYAEIEAEKAAAPPEDADARLRVFLCKKAASGS